MAQLFVDPSKVEELIKRLNTHTTEFQTRQKALKSYIQSMQQQWNDAHYKAFSEQFEEFNKLVLKAMQMSETILLPNLKNVKKFAEDYKNMGRK